MAYRFKIEESLEKGFRRVARLQIARALQELDGSVDVAKHVHESRKAIKRLRALLRLVRPAIGDKAFKARTAALRDVALALSAHRDHSILDETITKLERHAGNEHGALLAEVRRLAAPAHASGGDLDATTVGALRDSLVREGQRLDKLKFKSAAGTTFAPGLQHSYERGRTALSKACKKPSDLSFHDLRKASQWHWRHMALLSRAWPEYFEVRVAAARELSQILGDDHDLAVLSAAAKHVLAGPERAQIEQLIRDRQEALRREAHPRAQRLFAERPRDFVSRISFYWEAGQHITPRASATSDEDQDPKIQASDGNALESNSSAPRLTVRPGNDVPSQRRA
jgi:CHAD domain-containing protein